MEVKVGDGRRSRNLFTCDSDGHGGVLFDQLVYCHVALVLMNEGVIA